MISDIHGDMGERPDLRLLRVGHAGTERPAALDSSDRAYDLRPLTQEINGDFLASDGISRVRERMAAGALPELAIEGQRLGPPVARPGKIICIGMNYRDHARETGQEPPQEPVVFMKAPNTMIGPNDEVMIPRESVKTDWEVELAVVIGSTARYLPDRASALACVAGYCVSNDVSEREFQLERGGQWDKGKSCETFQPLGPWLVPADQVADPQALPLRLSVNHQQRQNGTTADMIFPVDHIIWYLSQFLVLEPGDVINTGTPAGVALGLPDHPYLKAGDVVELGIEGLGRQRQVMRQA
jgi:2-keto-4-pentenoate hydratase/2-oxohepta-3-ene-1,7-dioic acid hydratase in catechol pathway